MDQTPVRHWRLAGLDNLRDIGGYRSAGGGTTRWRRLWRADAPHRLEGIGCEALREAGLATVIDLRTVEEIAAAPSPFAGDTSVRYRHVSLFANLAPIRMLIEGNGGRPFRLVDRYRDALDRCREALAEVFAVIDQSGEGGVLVNCTAGKDRTGLVVALLLLALDVDVDTIVADYALTEEVAAPLFARLRANAIARGSDLASMGEVFSSPASAMRETLDYLAGTDNGPDGYLASIGVDAKARRRLGARFLDR